MSPAPTIGERLSGRDNNFNLLRFIAATLVIWSHSYALLDNGMASDPLVKILGFGWAGIAVDAFFVISGFLIVRSYLTHNNLRVYLTARLLRIMPGLVAAVLFCVFVVGLAQTELPTGKYLDHPRTWQFMQSNILLYDRMPHLPGVFMDNKSRTINGSLWTLSYEVTMYLVVALLGLLGWLRSRPALLLIMALYAVAYTALLLWPREAVELFSGRAILNYQRLSLYFAIGGACYLLRDHVTLRLSLLALLWVAAWLAYQTPLFKFAFSFALSYSIFWLALIPRGLVLRFNALDDYSYGIYIYAFPVQQSLIAWLDKPSEVQLFLLSCPPTFALAWLSCKAVEKPALALNRRLTRQHYARLATS